jgi:PAS domain-containing protein
MRQQQRRRHQTQTMPATEARFEQVVEMAPNATVVTDRRGRITLVNRQAEVLLGYPRTEQLGQLVERHGGTIGLSSVEGQGTTVWFTLPLVTADGDAPTDVDERDDVDN